VPYCILFKIRAAPDSVHNAEPACPQFTRTFEVELGTLV
jgi:hypothetical protein